MTDEKLTELAKSVAGGFSLDNDNSAGSVGAAVLTKSGGVYTGICIDTACGMGFCAEHAAIAEMLKHRETEIVKAVTVHDSGKIMPPCGRCRELMRQIDKRNADAVIVIAEAKTVTLRELLPYSYIGE